MRNRYYSPDNSSPLKVKRDEQKGANSKDKDLLRQATSARKLPASQNFAAEKKVGGYVYDVSNQIGRGFSSIVYKGAKIDDRSPCAVKVVDTKTYSPSSMRMLQNQIKMLRSLEHPNIIKCLDVFRTLTHCYIVTEYCPNGDLATFLTKQGRLQQVSAVSIMSQIVEGVKYLFSRGILHRDLKPANILKGEKNWKIADFGFAIFTEIKIKSRYNVGTPLYMSPQTLINNVYSPATDIFSVGIIFYEMLTGNTPWECKSQKNLVKKIKEQPYFFPEEVHVSKGIISALEAMCSKTAQQRMTKQSFMVLNLTFESVNPEDKRMQSNQPSTNDSKHLNKNTSLIFKHLQATTNELTPKIEIKNNHILINQLHYCRFIFYFIRNMKHLPTNSKNRNKLTLLLHTHLEKLINLLSDNKVNTFNLTNWSDFKSSKRYQTTQHTMKQYADRYSKEHLNFLKEVDSALVQQVKRSFSSFLLNQTFTTDSYAEILTFLQNSLREANHNLTIITKGCSEPLSVEIKANIQALKSLFKYYELIRLCLTHFQNYNAFEKQSNIRVQIDYSSSSLTLEDYSKLRNQLKSI